MNLFPSSRTIFRISSPTRLNVNPFANAVLLDPTPPPALSTRPVTTSAAVRALALAVCSNSASVPLCPSKKLYRWPFVGVPNFR